MLIQKKEKKEKIYIKKLRIVVVYISIWIHDHSERQVKVKIFSLDVLEVGEHLAVTMGDNNPVDNKTLRELFSPVTTNRQSCTILALVDAAHFELKSQVIQLLPSIYELDREDLYMYLKDFLRSVPYLSSIIFLMNESYFLFH